MEGEVRDDRSGRSEMDGHGIGVELRVKGLGKQLFAYLIAEAAENALISVDAAVA